MIRTHYVEAHSPGSYSRAWGKIGTVRDGRKLLHLPACGLPKRKGDRTSLVLLNVTCRGCLRWIVDYCIAAEVDLEHLEVAEREAMAWLQREREHDQQMELLRVVVPPTDDKA